MAMLSTRNGFILGLSKWFLRVLHPGLRDNRQRGRLKPGCTLDGFMPEHTQVLWRVRLLSVVMEALPLTITQLFLCSLPSPSLLHKHKFSSNLSEIATDRPIFTLVAWPLECPQYDTLKGSVSSFTADYSGGKMLHRRGTGTKYSPSHGKC